MSFDKIFMMKPSKQAFVILTMASLEHRSMSFHWLNTSRSDTGNKPSRRWECSLTISDTSLPDPLLRHARLGNRKIVAKRKVRPTRKSSVSQVIISKGNIFHTLASPRNIFGLTNRRRYIGALFIILTYNNIYTYILITFTFFFGRG